MPRTGTCISFYFRNNTIHIFQDSIKSLGSPEFIRFRLSDDRRRMIMEPYDRKELTSFKTKLRTESNHSMQLRGKRFCRVMLREMGWDSCKSYRIPGRLYTRQNLVLYNLEHAEEITHKE